LRKIAELIPVRGIRPQKEFLLIPFDSPIFFFYGNGKTLSWPYLLSVHSTRYRSIVITTSRWTFFSLHMHAHRIITDTRTGTRMYTRTLCPSNSELTIKILAVCVRTITRAHPERKVRRMRLQENR